MLMIELIIRAATINLHVARRRRHQYLPFVGAAVTAHVVYDKSVHMRAAVIITVASQIRRHLHRTKRRHRARIGIAGIGGSNERIDEGRQIVRFRGGNETDKNKTASD